MGHQGAVFKAFFLGYVQETDFLFNRYHAWPPAYAILLNHIRGKSRTERKSNILMIGGSTPDEEKKNVLINSQTPVRRIQRKDSVYVWPACRPSNNTSLP